MEGDIAQMGQFIGAGLAAGHRCVDEGETAPLRFGVRLASHPRRGRGVIDEYRAGLHPFERAVGADCHRAQVVVVADAELSATLEGLDIQEPTWWATVVGVGVLLFTATTVLVTLHNTLNRIFKVGTAQTAGAGIWKMIRDRFVSLSLVITIAFILLVSLMVDAMITAFGAIAVRYGGEWATFMVKFDSIVLDVGANTILFALFFRYLPDIRLAWKDIWFGALLTAVLFSVGKHLIALIIGNSTAADMYEAAGSVLVLMLWIYYASAIFLFGATFTFTRAQLMKPNVA